MHSACRLTEQNTSISSTWIVVWSGSDVVVIWIHVDVIATTTGDDVNDSGFVSSSILHRNHTKTLQSAFYQAIEMEILRPAAASLTRIDGTGNE